MLSHRQLFRLFLLGSALIFCFNVFSTTTDALADDAVYTVIDLGAFTPTQGVVPQSCDKYAYLSNNGEVAYTRGTRAKKYSVGIGERDLGGIYDGEAVSYSFVSGIDDNGVVYGDSEHLVNASLQVAATVFSNNTAQNISIGSFPADHQVFPTAVSNSGRKLRSIGIIVATNTPLVCEWEDLSGSTAPGDFNNPIACAVNDSGAFVGTAGFDAALHSADGTITKFKHEDFNIMSGMTAVSISNDGKILITNTAGTPNGIWIIDGADRTNLTGFSLAAGMNNFGEVVGMGPIPRPVVLYKGGQYYELDQMIEPGLGIHFIRPYAINDSRQIVVSGMASDKTVHTYLLTESTPSFQPDLTIGIGVSAVGTKLFNSTGAGQTSSFKLKKGKSKTITVQLVNGGKSTETFSLKGTGSNRQFTVQYLFGRTDITAAVKPGKYKIAKLPPNAAKTIKVKVTALAKGTKTSTFTLTAKSTTDKTKVDAVKITAQQS